MSSILYYSNYCSSCKNLLKYFAQSKIKNEIHFLSIDSRIEQKGKIYILLEKWTKKCYFLK